MGRFALGRLYRALDQFDFNSDLDVSTVKGLAGLAGYGNPARFLKSGALPELFEARFFDIATDALDRASDFAMRYAENSGNFNPLLKILAKMDALEAQIVDADSVYNVATLDRLRDDIDSVVDTLNANNVYRKAPKFDAGHIDWILGQNLETFETAQDRDLFNEGNIDYFNVNTGGRDNLYGEGFPGAGNNNVNASLQAATAGSTMTIGIEFRSYDGRNISGVEALDAMWKDYMARLGDDQDVTLTEVIEEYSGGEFEAFSDAFFFGGSWTPEQFELQADSILSFAELLRDQGGHIGEIHVRPGYEFDGDFNASADIDGTPAQYINAFKLVAELLKGEDNFGLDNVQMVWQSQSGAERSPLAIYDEANGDETVTKQSVFDHLDQWWVEGEVTGGGDFIDIVGMSFFQTEESARSWAFADGTADNGKAVMPDFDLFMQAFADYAEAKGKALDISESTPAGAYLDRDQFNEVVQERLDELGPDYDGPIRLLEEGEIAFAKFHSGADADGRNPGGTMIDKFFDDGDPLFYISSTAQVWNEYFVPFFQFVKENADNIDSINMISYNWDEIQVFNSLETEARDGGVNVNFGSGNWWDNEELLNLMNDYTEDLFG